MNKKGFFPLLSVLVVIFALSPGNAGAVLKDVGPVDSPSPPGNGFPTWYRDASATLPGFPLGVPLDLCLSTVLSPVPAVPPDPPGLMCNLLPGPTFDPELPMSFPDNFPDEAFWWTGDARLRGELTSFGDRTIEFDAILIMALEAAFTVGDPVPGDQVSFARIRLRVHTLAPGHYVVTHPYGVYHFDVTEEVLIETSGRRAINFTEDIGIAEGDFSGALQGRIGPFLRWDALTPQEQATYGSADLPLTVDGEQFIGDPGVLHTVTGSPFGTNYFRIDGPPGSAIGGRVNPPFDNTAIDFVETNEFAVSGKIHATPIPTRLTVDRATYARDADATQIDVLATADTVSNTLAPTVLEVSGLNVPTTVMDNDAVGNYFATIRFSGSVAPPGTITVTNLSDNTASVPAPSMTTPLVDEVSVVAANYNPLDDSLSIRASSRDLQALPALTSNMGALGSAGTLVVTGVAVPPTHVTVTSTIGGGITRPVSVVVPPPPASGVSLSADPASPQSPGLPVVFTATGSGGSDVYEYQFWLFDGVAWAVRRTYSPAGAWTWDTTGSPVGQYVAAVWARNVGSTEEFEAVGYHSFVLGVESPPVSGVTLSANAGDTGIAFTALAEGGSGSYEHQFWLFDGISWSVRRAYSGLSTWDLTTSDLPAGQYVAAVWARNVGSAAEFEAVGYHSFVLGAAAPVSGVTLSANAGETGIAFTALAEGGSGSYEHQFWLFDGTSWSVRQAYSGLSTWDLTTSDLPAGQYAAAVWARNAGSSAEFEAVGYNFFTVQAVP